MNKGICKLEALSFPVESDKKYILTLKGFLKPESVDLMAKALRGVFPDHTPILILNEGQTIEVFSVSEGDTVRVNPPMNTHLVALIKEMLPDGVEVVNGVS